jgi:hypothetical protein
MPRTLLRWDFLEGSRAAAGVALLTINNSATASLR